VLPVLTVVVVVVVVPLVVTVDDPVPAVVWPAPGTPVAILQFTVVAPVPQPLVRPESALKVLLTQPVRMVDEATSKRLVTKRMTHFHTKLMAKNGGLVLILR